MTYEQFIDRLARTAPPSTTKLDISRIKGTEDDREFAQIVRKYADNQDLKPFADDPEVADFIAKGLTTENVNNLVTQNKGLRDLVVNRIQVALEAVKRRLVNRDNAVEMMAACAIAKVNMIFLGPPGTAKSQMVRFFAQAMGVRPESKHIREERAMIDMARSVDGNYEAPTRRMFEYLLTRYTTPEELFGSIDIDMMLKAGVHGRRSQGMLPQAEVAFLDEIFKANSAILNTLLSITNERLFYNMGQAFEVSLAFVVGASNETPDEAELGALYDRFPIRVLCKQVASNSLQKLVQRSHYSELGNEIPQVACLNDLRLLGRVVLEAAYGGAKDAFPDDDFADLFMNLLHAMRDDYKISDRTPARLLRVCRALALIEGERPGEALTVRHLRVFGYLAHRMEDMTDSQMFVKNFIENIDDTGGKLFDHV
jgi:MoxR-like ATPase